MQKVLRYGSLGLAATLLISACTPAMTTPPTDGPAHPLAPFAGEAFPEDLAPAFPGDVQPLQTAPQAPQPPLSVNERGLVLPTGGNVSLDQLYEDLPSSIPQEEAGDWLSPMPGAIPEGFGQGVPGGIGPDSFGPGGYGAYPGIIPDLLTYNALARCMYFRYMNFWVPYFLVGNCYYPYAYSPYYNAALSGLYAYPLFYSYGDYCYPYYFLSSRYRYGYLDWEYYWPTYRSKYRHRYDDDFRHYRGRWGSRHFKGWLDDRRRDRHQENWRERARDYRRDRGDRPNRPDYNQGNRPGNQHGNRPDWNDRPGNPQGNRPDRGDRHERPDRYDRPDRPDYNQGNRPRPHQGEERPDYNQGKRHRSEGHERQGNEGQVREGDGGEGRERVRGDRPERDRPNRQVRRNDGENRHVRRGGEGQQARRGGGQKARDHGKGGRMRPAGVESPDDTPIEAGIIEESED